MLARSPAEGLWDDGVAIERDALLVFEVMVESLDRAWWGAYRRTLETRFAQDRIVVRAAPVELL